MKITRRGTLASLLPEGSSYLARLQLVVPLQCSHICILIVPPTTPQTSGSFSCVLLSAFLKDRFLLGLRLTEWFLVPRPNQWFLSCVLLSVFLKDWFLLGLRLTEWFLVPRPNQWFLSCVLLSVFLKDWFQLSVLQKQRCSPR
jgi:hypothetical protein